ncbi:MAG: hypothetical protein KDA24_02110 [Deltaproteobacteria bacterium]|nr:hypothetical protein [Deltaproteobacteria bacterium]
MTAPFARESRDARIQLAVVVFAALLVRLLLAPRYFGWEEGDYGNLMMIREVIDSKFTWFRSAHMPGWYSLGAVARLLGGGAERGPALAMTMGFSIASVGLATALARRLSGGSAAWLVGLWLVFQPEMALYGASTLRSPVFTCLGLAALVLLLRGRQAGHAVTAAAFLVRMEAFFVFFIPSLFAWGRQRGRSWVRLLPGVVLLAVTVASWQLYISVAQGETGPFFAGPLGQNRPEGVSLWDFALNGAATAWHLATWTLPRKVSWTALVLAGIGLTSVLSGFGRAGGRSVAGYGLFTLGFWLAEGFISQQDPNHNLYWVWLMPALPPLFLLAGVGWQWVEERLSPLPRAGRAALFGLVLLSAAPSFLSESRYQMERSEAWYRPQLELSRWLETNARPGAGMILGSIPEVWVQRRAHAFRVTSWWFLPPSLKEKPKEQFGAFLVDQRVDYVMWFAEEWTEASAFAPWLADGAPVQAGPARLVPVDREDGYGWILYVVERSGEDPPPRPPAFGSGAVVGPGWGA